MMFEYPNFHLKPRPPLSSEIAVLVRLHTSFSSRLTEHAIPLTKLITGAVDISRIIDQRGSKSPSTRRPSPSDSGEGQSRLGSHSSSAYVSSQPRGAQPPPNYQSTSPSYHYGEAQSSREAEQYGYSTYAASASGQRPVDRVESPYSSHKRTSVGDHSLEQPAKKQSKWSPAEDTLLIQLRGENMKWEEISKRLPGRSAISCRLHYQNFLERKAEWNRERDAKMARLYDRFKKDMWEKVAKEMQMPWRAVEARHWEIGQEEMAKLAGATMFSSTATPMSEHDTLPPTAPQSFHSEYPPPSLRHPYATYPQEPSTVQPARLHPMGPPLRPDVHMSGYSDPITGPPGPLPGIAEFQRQPLDFQNEHMPASTSSERPPHDRQQLPPMRYLTEPRYTSQQQQQQQQSSSAYYERPEDRPRQPARSSDPSRDRERRQG